MLWYDASHCDDSSFCNYSTCPKFFVVLSCIRTQTRNRLLSWIWNTGIAWTAMSPGSTVYWPRVAGWSRLCTYWHKDMSFFNRRFQYFKSVVRSMTRQPLSFSTFFQKEWITGSFSSSKLFEAVSAYSGTLEESQLLSSVYFDSWKLSTCPVRCSQIVEVDIGSWIGIGYHLGVAPSQ